MDDNNTLTKMDSHCAQPKYCGHWTVTVSFSQKSTEKGIGTRVKHAPFPYHPFAFQVPINTCRALREKTGCKQSSMQIPKINKQ